MPKRRLYDESLNQKLVSTTSEYVKGREVPQGLILYVVHGALEDETSSPDSLSFGKLIGSRFEALEEDDGPVSGVRYHTEHTHHFLPGETPCWRVEGGVADDVLTSHMEGYYEETE